MTVDKPSALEDIVESIENSRSRRHLDLWEAVQGVVRDEPLPHEQVAQADKELELLGIGQLEGLRQHVCDVRNLDMDVVPVVERGEDGHEDLREEDTHREALQTECS